MNVPMRGKPRTLERTMMNGWRERGVIVEKGEGRMEEDGDSARVFEEF